MAGSAGKITTTRPDDHSLIPSICVLGGENQLHKLPADLYMCTVTWHTYTQAHTDTHK